jgi:hypothetical protein
MKRIAKRIVSLVGSVFVVGGIASACASEQSVNSGFGPDASANACAPQFCPTMGAGQGCCMTAAGPCGVDYGMGCVAATKDGG